jgi:hypothetical protein
MIGPARNEHREQRLPDGKVAGGKWRRGTQVSYARDMCLKAEEVQHTLNEDSGRI